VQEEHEADVYDGCYQPGTDDAPERKGVAKPEETAKALADWAPALRTAEGDQIHSRLARGRRALVR